MNTGVVEFDTFFECISYALGGLHSPDEIQHRCVTLFEEHLFKSAEPDTHLAVRLWKKRLKSGDIEELAHRFIHYHVKPKRLACQWTFAALVNELYPVQVGIIKKETGDVCWINNSDQAEYFIQRDDGNVAYVTLQHQGEKWRVLDLETQRQEVTLRMVPIKEEYIPEEFCVRAAYDGGVRKNLKVGDMQRVADNVYHFTLTQWNERATYQIYPGGDKNTFYKPLPNGVGLFLFGSTSALGTLTLLAQTMTHDVYLYCKPAKEVTKLVLVKANSEEVARATVNLR